MAYAQHQSFQKSWDNSSLVCMEISCVMVERYLYLFTFSNYKVDMAYQGVDYDGLSKSEMFQNYMKKSAELHRVDLSPLTRNELVI